MIVAADPQYEWHCGSYTLCAKQTSKLDSQAKLSNKWQTDSFNKLKLQYGDALKGVIVNGDLTAFGHTAQLDGYKKYFKKRINMSVYPGLGNHDYANNIDDCWRNNCAIRMVDYMHEIVSKLKPKPISYDYKTSSTYYEFPVLRKDHTGSLAYMIEIGGVYFIQLHNYPSYAVKFNGWNITGARRDYYVIKPSFKWLEENLKLAQTNKKNVIVNLHDYKDHMKYEDRKKFGALLDKYEVSGVFWGHFHSRIGKYSQGIKTPVFSSGSSPYNTYLLLKFSNQELVEVTSIDSSYGDATVLNVYPVNNE